MDESQPEQWVIPMGTHTVAFFNSRSRALDRIALESAILPQGSRAEIRSIQIEPDSQMSSAWVVNLFPNIKGAWLMGAKLKSFDELGGLSSLVDLSITSPARLGDNLRILRKLQLKNLWLEKVAAAHVDCLNGSLLQRLRLSSWQKRDFTDVPEMSAHDLTVTSRILQNTRGLNCAALEKARFAACTELRHLDDLSVGELWIEACRNLAIDTLANVRGLRSLTLVSQVLPSFEFVFGCQELERLFIGAAETPPRVGPLIQSASLRLISICPARNSLIREIGEANPNVIVSNTSVCFRDGRQVDMSEWWKARGQMPVARAESLNRLDDAEQQRRGHL